MPLPLLEKRPRWRGFGARRGGRVDERLYPFRSRWFRRGNLALHYVDEGAGAPIVLIHGNPTWSFYYREVIKALAPEYRVVAPDHMGCGLSSRPSDRQFRYTLASHVENLEALLDELGLTENVTLVMHDWGGMIGMACACRRPERIARIVLLNTAAFLMPPGKRLPWRLRVVKSVPLLPSLFVRGGNAFAGAATYMAVCRPLSAAVRRGYLDPYDSWRRRVATLRFVQDIPLSPRDASYGLAAWVDRSIGQFRDRPMLICWGEQDFVFDGKILAEWRRRFPGAEVHTFAGAGHYLLEDAGEQVIAHLRDFLARYPLDRDTRGPRAADVVESPVTEAEAR
ncbi:MAG: alpha/beta fold hydrolase [Thermoleophilia bacterium]